MTDQTPESRTDPDIDPCLLLAAQMRSLSHLYHGVVHDLKSPLNALVVNLELLRSSLTPDTPQAERQQRYASVLREELQRLNRSVESLLAAAAPPGAEHGRFDLGDVLDELVALVEPQARHQGVRVEIAQDRQGRSPLPVEGYRDRIKHALLAVAVNALEAMPEGGTLSLAAASQGGRARVAITDTGPGVAPEARDRLFERGVSTKEGHAGIGLFVAQQVVNSSRGSIQLSSIPDTGSRFEVLLPLVDRAQDRT